LQRRLPLANVILAPTPVQGDEAPLAIISAIKNLNRLGAPDVILLARGGGLIEDLWAFNNEGVVRAVIESAAPVITGVGHETDFTLADFASDLRAPTPTAAAELATPVTLSDLNSNLADLRAILVRRMEVMLRQRRDSSDWLGGRLLRSSPGRRLQTERQRLDEMGRRVSYSQSHRLEVDGERLKGLESRLMALSPLAVLRRGYAVVMKNKKAVTSLAQVSLEDTLRVHVQDGEFNARVTGTG
jgi:exodeoxyribonuclease VII large subunit